MREVDDRIDKNVGPYDRIQFFMDAGRVERLHTVPHHLPYSVGQHSYNALTLLLVLHPNPSLSLIKYVLWHDSGETFTGDVPAPAKWGSQELQTALKVIEDRLFEKFGVHHLWFGLSSEEATWAKAVDLLELMLYCRAEMAMGNKRVKLCWERVEAAFLRSEWPTEVKQFYDGLAAEPMFFGEGASDDPS